MRCITSTKATTSLANLPFCIRTLTLNTGNREATNSDAETGKIIRKLVLRKIKYVNNFLKFFLCGINEVRKCLQIGFLKVFLSKEDWGGGIKAEMELHFQLHRG